MKNHYRERDRRERQQARRERRQVRQRTKNRQPRISATVHMIGGD
jgi:hypothetical protein